ncbi:MAG: hypothetical protein HC902_02180 [Calothrix sp. SM1_5_4]|nr:hypothetical protein [Calothrix sp. SM1_5_4]
MIQRRFGGLEEMRAKLGLSRRKICQLLLVDPSAWSRWTAAGGQAPPHIFRALEWYLLLSEKDPRITLSGGSWIASLFNERFDAIERRLKSLARTRWLLLTFVLGVFGGAGVVLILR